MSESFNYGIQSTAGRTAPFQFVGRALDWLRGYEKLVLAAGLVLQFCVLGSMIFMQATPLLTGETILLRVVPVDPRDMFRGEYVILSYDFSRTMPPEVYQATGDSSQWNGHTVYAHLVADADGEHWSVSEVTLTPPAQGPYLRGTIVGPYRAEYGIESYFVQEGRGKEIENAIRNGQVSAEVAVTEDGTAALKGLKLP